MVRLLLCIALLFLSGCGSKGPATYSVSGQFTYKGDPVADAQVAFVPVSGAPAELKPARGQTDSQGNFTLKTYLGPGDEAAGAMAGKYKVTIEKGLPQNQIVSYEDLKNQKPLLPPPYADAQKTPFEREVTAAGPNKFDFTLEDAAP
jgi:hypothetical protein